MYIITVRLQQLHCDDFNNKMSPSFCFYANEMMQTYYGLSFLPLVVNIDYNKKSQERHLAIHGHALDVGSTLSVVTNFIHSRKMTTSRVSDKVTVMHF